MKQPVRIYFGFILTAGLLAWNPTAVVGETNRVELSPSFPPLPVMKSPMESFRALLVMPTAERRAQLATCTAEVRGKLIAKVNEYQGLSLEERDLRLKATELHWYLKPLMASTPTNRAGQLALIPESLREMVTTRITQWDRFPPTIQQMMLTNPAGPSYMVIGTDTNFPPTPVAQIGSAMQVRYNRLFELTAEEKEKVLATLSEAERRQMEKTLEAFKKLSAVQRRQCVLSFTRFSGLNPAEQQEFLKNAEHWSQMSATERQAWRELVNTAPKVPPLPSLTRQTPTIPRNPSKPARVSSTNGR